ncbi:MAG TPA: hypothetical protein VIV07_05110 [Sphingomicrobium sp.]
MRVITGFALLLTASAGVAARAQAPAADPQQLLQNCEAHKFETTVQSVVDGEPHQSKVKLCGQTGQSDADWIHTLQDAIAKLNANKDMPAAMRQQIVGAINVEITRLQAAAAASVPKPRALPAPAEPLSSDYAALPPLPSAPPPPPRLLGPGGEGQKVLTRTSGSKRVVYQAPALAAPPRLEFSCYSPDDIGGDAPCLGFERETRLTLLAKEDLPAGMQLRFVRNGDKESDVDLAKLPKGRSVQIMLPRDVCAGFGDGRLDLQIVQNGAVAKLGGPYPLRC